MRLNHKIISLSKRSYNNNKKTQLDNTPEINFKRLDTEFN